jgi:hypothetical protein
MGFYAEIVPEPPVTNESGVVSGRYRGAGILEGAPPRVFERFYRVQTPGPRETSHSHVGPFSASSKVRGLTCCAHPKTWTEKRGVLTINRGDVPFGERKRVSFGALACLSVLILFVANCSGSAISSSETSQEEEDSVCH